MNAWWAVLATVAAVVAWPSSTRAERPLFSPRTGNATAPDDPLTVAYRMDLLALALAGGAPGVVALEAVGAAGRASSADSSVGSPHGRGDVLSRVAAALRWGVDERKAWAMAPPLWRPVASAFELAARCGAAPSTLLRQAARDLREAEAERVATAGAKAGVRIVLPLGLCFLPAFVLITIVPMVLGLIELPA